MGARSPRPRAPIDKERAGSDGEDMEGAPQAANTDTVTITNVECSLCATQLGLHRTVCANGSAGSDCGGVRRNTDDR